MRNRHRLGVIMACAMSAAFFVEAQAAKPSEAPPSSSKTKTSFSAFVQKLHTEGDDNFIRPNVAPFLTLTPSAPTKAYIVDTFASKDGRQPEKICNLVLEQSDPAGKPEPMCAVFIDASIGSESIVSYYYKVGLDGKLLTAVRLTGKRADGKPIRGSGVKTDLDIASPETQAAFKKELDFWLSGRFRKHWKPKAGAKSAQN